MGFNGMNILVTPGQLIVTLSNKQYGKIWENRTFTGGQT
ncbi:MAG: hypothetical protein JWR54_3461 [Mucilaginibacter sp.]|nr:hypothetical protein [Mucilaginibacter sp.]